MTFKKTKLVLGIMTATLTLVGAMASPEALAHKKSHKHKHKVKTHKVHTGKASVAPAYVAPAAVAYDDSALKQQLADQAAEINKLKAQPAPEVAPVKDSKDNMVFFRGGWGHATQERRGVSINSNGLGGAFGNGAKSDKNSWYIGAGLDFSADDNLFGLMDKTEVLGELAFQYQEFGNRVTGNGLVSPNPSNVTVSQFTLSASPKIKFMKGSDFRPWVIPIGMAINVISPPSEQITVLQPAMMFGIGADYRVWKNIFVGADARYLQGIGSLDKVNTNGVTVGGYLGLGF